jgi:hypothetical protein
MGFLFQAFIFKGIYGFFASPMTSFLTKPLNISGVSNNGLFNDMLDDW